MRADVDPAALDRVIKLLAERQNRTCYAMEIGPAYVDAAVTRWEAYTGGAAAKDEKRGNDGG